MSRPISTDLRERLVLAVSREGISARAAAARFGVSVSSAIVWVRRHRGTGIVAPGKIGGHKPNILSGTHGDWLVERGVRVDYVQVWRFVHARGLSFKKSVLPAEQLRPKIARRRAHWRKYQGRLDPRHLVFMDETWAKTNMAPLRGWAPKGQRLHAKVSYGHWRTMTFIAALRCDRIDASCVLDQPINGASFAEWVEQFLVPALAPGDVVIINNLSSHKRPAIRQAIRAAKAKLLDLPPYSPDLNPIEQMFSKLKHLLRKASERTAENTWRRIGSLLDAFGPQECANYFVNSGYAST